ncbi:MAG: Rossmann-like and DUF2520 domain-containing protein [Bacteroidota bacterium]
MNKIGIIGSGNVATHLGKALHQKGFNIAFVFSRNDNHARKLANILDAQPVHEFEKIDFQGVDLALICVPDQAIHPTIERIPSKAPVAYTSGSIKLENLPDRDHIGVFYPLQSFSKERAVDVASVPFLIEASTTSFAEELRSLADQLSNTVLSADSEKRYQLHIAAVLVNNFTNHLYSLAANHVEAHKLDFKLLKPLIQETVKKLDDMHPRDAQTGPARRGDHKVIEHHLNSLDGRTRTIYELLSLSIDEKYNHEL